MDWDKIEKARKGLRTCVESEGIGCPLSCPYYEPCMADPRHIYSPMMNDVLTEYERMMEQIKTPEAARIPRLLTLEEIRALPLGAVIWLEYKAVDEDGITDISLHPVMRSVCCGDAVLCDGESQTEIDTITLEPDDCGGMERYWSARPTDEQREAVAWDE